MLLTYRLRGEKRDNMKKYNKDAGLIGLLEDMAYDADCIHDEAGNIIRDIPADFPGYIGSFFNI